jgi:hypothetical protein
MGLVMLGRQKLTAEPIVPEPSIFEVEMNTEKLKRCKSPGIDQIPAELIKAGGRKISSEINKLINSIWNKEEMLEEWKELIILPIYMKGDKTDCSNYTDISVLQLHTKFYPTSYCQGELHMYRKLLRIINVDFDATDQLLVVVVFRVC